ncbi:S-adenosylmethionine decarboxylase [Candidatus Woesearchaeota archaeon]|nr:S-adenosylmethionine decarboxylase [Candidatus Woesearchaeota archaeon]
MFAYGGMRRGRSTLETKKKHAADEHGIDNIVSPHPNDILVVCYGCNGELFHDVKTMAKIAIKGLKKEGYKIIAGSFATFNDRDIPGHSGALVISESHFNWHTYFEFERRIDLFLNTCRGPEAGWATIADVVNSIKPAEVYARSARIEPQVKGYDFVFPKGPADDFISYIDLKVQNTATDFLHYCNEKKQLSLS